MNKLFTACFLILVFSLSFSGAQAGSDGKQLYLQNCSVCHGVDGTGSMPGVANLQENIGWTKVDDKEMLEQIKQGIQKPGSRFRMPAKGGNQNLTDDDLKNILKHMRQSFFK